MNKMSKNLMRLKRKRRVRSKINGTGEIPRLSVFRSLKNIYLQIIDDEKQKTIVSADMKEIAGAKKSTANNIASAKKLGKILAEKCLKAKVKKVVFDRGGYRYHGRVKAIADAAREAGLEI